MVLMVKCGCHSIPPILFVGEICQLKTAIQCFFQKCNTTRVQVMYFPAQKGEILIPLMEEILHQLIW